jgi:histone-lysine N-methyltransferase EZH2
VPEPKRSSSVERQVEGVLKKSEWKPIEKELYLKGVEIFGKNRYGVAYINNISCMHAGR